jgi:hypothetical protein
MKTLREYLDQLDEISRRDFLKGAGATAGLAAVGAPKDAKADWERLPSITDKMSDEVTDRFINVSNDGTATLKYFDTTGGQFQQRSLTLKRNNGVWRQPPRSSGFAYGRLRVDNFRPFDISFGWMEDFQTRRVVLNDVSISAAGGRPFGDEYIAMINALLQAKQRILIDASTIGGDILEFNPRSNQSPAQTKQQSNQPPQQNPQSSEKMQKNRDGTTTITYSDGSKLIVDATGKPLKAFDEQGKSVVIPK